MPRENVLAAKVDISFVRAAGKGMIMRKLTERAYVGEIDAFYSGPSIREYMKKRTHCGAHYFTSQLWYYLASSQGI